jgi:hypothetical protein
MANGLGLRPAPAMLAPCVATPTDRPLVVGVRRTKRMSEMITSDRDEANG